MATAHWNIASLIGLFKISWPISKQVLTFKGITLRPKLQQAVSEQLNHGDDYLMRSGKPIQETRQVNDPSGGTFQTTMQVVDPTLIMRSY